MTDCTDLDGHNFCIEFHVANINYARRQDSKIEVPLILIYGPKGITWKVPAREREGLTVPPKTTRTTFGRYLP